MTVKLHTLVIGAGVVGLAVARRFAKAGHEVFVSEAESSIGSVISARNSEVIHGGMYYPSGSLRSLHCVRGRRMIYEYCCQRHIAYKKCGKLIVAVEEKERKKIESIYQQGLVNGVEGLRLLESHEARRLEPHLSCDAAVLSSETGILDSHAFMLSLQGDMEDYGGLLALRTKVISIWCSGSNKFRKWQVQFQSGDIADFDCILNCAGLGAQEIASKTEGYPSSRIPRLHLAKGNYFQYLGKPIFQRLIYPAPLEGGLGTHVTIDLAGRMRFGPDVEWVDRLDYHVNPDRSREFYQAIRRYFPGLEDGRLAADYAGIRPKLSGPGEPARDFVIDGPSEHGLSSFVSLFGIESPGLTASLSLADAVYQLLGNPR